jgi:hypothetical protein
MCNRVTALAFLLAGLFFTVSAHADKVHLQGGAVLEGKVSRVGDKILVEVDSGTLSLDARSVVRVESAPSSLETFLVRHAALSKGDVAARLALADYCREHQMFARERELLREVLQIDPNHTQARVRLGFVRGERGWLTRDEQLASQGMVKQAGVWLSPEQAARLRQAELERETAELARQTAESELLARRAELRAERERNERNQRIEQDRAAASMIVPLGWFSYPARPAACPMPALSPPSAPLPFAINGVRDPQSYFR